MKKQYIFHAREYREKPSVYVAEGTDVNDVLFDFVHNILGYSILEVESKDQIRVKEV